MLNSKLTTINNKKLKEIYLSLSFEEKQIVDRYGAHYCIQPSCEKESFSPRNLCEFLWVSAANIIPQGYYSLAEKLLKEALNYTNNSLDRGHIHSNLAQIYADTLQYEQCYNQCKEVLSTGYFVPWAEAMISNISEYDILLSKDALPSHTDRVLGE